VLIPFFWLKAPFQLRDRAGIVFNHDLPLGEVQSTVPAVRTVAGIHIVAGGVKQIPSTIP
jgi:hypothetical protein